MKENFNRCLEHILQYEGGYVNDPRDPGGSTNMGITIKTLGRYRDRPVTVDDVKNLGIDEVRNIYKKLYWDAVLGDDMPSGIDLILFDCAVNQGPGRAAKFLQMALKKNGKRVVADGVIGPKTLEATISAVHISVLLEFVSLRMNNYGKLSNLFRTFGLGWSRRLIHVCHVASNMVEQHIRS